ncbi:unnamed protein product [Rotaria magnacalcarata]|uniref:SH3 domain-containing protein n=2 Tax=Rotaria magnacalcarata TaxID=392030 RepID=A0A814FX47_9BILA|nr:unnamed protein product [Rotaria magnacalcarata]
MDTSLGTYIVNFNYTAQSSDELTMRKGDIITDVLPSEDGWLKGELQDKVGHFPKNYVTPLNKGKNKNKTLIAMQPGNKGDTLSKRSLASASTITQHTTLFQARVNHTYLPKRDDELSIKRNDIINVTRLVEKGWYEGILNGKSGLFPSNYVTRINEDENSSIKQKSIDGRTTPVQRDLPKKILSTKARVLYDYKAVSNDELTLKTNDIVIILDKNVGEDGWWKGELNGHIGIFPDNYVEEIPALTNLKHRSNASDGETKHSSQTLSKVEPIVDNSFHDHSNEHHPTTKSTSISTDKDDVSRNSCEEKKTLDSPERSNEHDKPISILTNRPTSSLARKNENGLNKTTSSFDETNLLQSIDLKNGNKIHTPSPPSYQREPGQIESPRYINRSLPLANGSTLNNTNESKNSSLLTVEQLQKELLKLKLTLDEVKVKFTDQIDDLIHELDEEKKARATLQIEIERLQKLFQKLSRINS